MNISYLKNKNIHFIECKDWHDVYGYEKSEMKEDIINYIEQLQQENQQLKDNWDKLKEHLKEKIAEGRSPEHLWLMGCYDEDKLILDKMQELQGSDSYE